MAITVLIADDHAFTLLGMQRALAALPGFAVVATASGGVEAIALARAHRPDIAVLDYAMPDITGIEAIAEIRRWSPETRCALVTGTSSDAVLRQLDESGIHGLFLKNADPDEICEGIRRIGQGETVRGSGLPRPADTDAPQLSDRETEVLFGIGRGLTNAQIAENLGISPKTVESHRTSLMRKLGVHSTAALLLRAVRDGLLSV
jgi:DNA-binding NarL/FixJ family response regulator